MTTAAHARQPRNGRKPRIALASTSPRRRALLTQHGFEHTAFNPGIDDGPLRPGRVTPEQWVTALAYLKLRAGLDVLAADPDADDVSLVIAADTIVIKDARILGQPRDAEDARRIVTELTDGSHRVITGVALCRRPEQTISFIVDASNVHVGPIPADAISRYIDSGAWAGKAGGYNLAERIEAGWPITPDGDPTSIMGLPMRRLEPILREALADTRTDHSTSPDPSA